MNLSKSEEDRLLEESASRYLKDRKQPLPGRGAWSAFAEMGWLALPIAEEYGGYGAELSTLATLAEQLGQARASEPYIPTVVHAATALSRLKGDVGAGLLASIAIGEKIVALHAGTPMAAKAHEEGWYLNGEQRLFPGAAAADILLFQAQLPDGPLALFALDKTSFGVKIKTVSAIDGQDLADVALTSVFAGPANLISKSGVAEALDAAMDYATVLYCADAIGAMTALIKSTIDYTGTRQQFGRPIRSFQVIEHRIADLTIALEEAKAATQLGLLALRDAAAPRHRAVSAAKVKTGASARLIAQQSIQLHGAMGVTEELEVGQYVRRLMAFEVLCGDRSKHLSRYAALARAGALTQYLGESAGEDSGLKLPQSARVFKTRVTAFLEHNLPKPLARAQQLTPTVYPEGDIAGAWQAILHRQGWSAPNWPAAYGGTGWEPIQRYIWAQEAGKHFAPITSPIGLQLVGPVLMHFGTEAQKSRYLPPIISGAEIWCQGFSEPGAGSDLAALAMRATAHGDDYIVNGTKIWTTQGHFSQFMVALVRTGPPGGRREGISFLIIDMQSPGIEIRPIITIGGDHEVNQIFFDDVRVPRQNLVGAEGQGWDIAKFLLNYERGGDIMSAAQRALLEEVRQAAIAQNIDCPAFWTSFALAGIDIDTLEMMELRALLDTANASGAGPSVLKLRASEIQQTVTELALRTLGPELLRWNSHRPFYGDPNATGPDVFVSRYLNSRANTIFGGTLEIQKSIIAKTAIG